MSAPEDTSSSNNNNGGKKEVAFEPLLATTIDTGKSYGSMLMDDATDVTEPNSTEDACSTSTSSSGNGRGRYFRRESSLDSSNHRYSLLTENMMTRIRSAAAKFELAEVPMQVKNNIKLVTDPNMEENERGMVYINEASIYQAGVEPEYALTVNTDIYSRILREVNDSFDVPCGLYFCCHGGDGGKYSSETLKTNLVSLVAAPPCCCCFSHTTDSIHSFHISCLAAAHSGVSHDDHVDIRLAWIALACILGTMMVFEIITPDVVDSFYVVNSDE